MLPSLPAANTFHAASVGAQRVAAARLTNAPTREVPARHDLALAHVHAEADAAQGDADAEHDGDHPDVQPGLGAVVVQGPSWNNNCLLYFRSKASEHA